MSDRPAPAAPYGPNTAAVRAFLRDLAQQPPVAWAGAAAAYAVSRAGDRFTRADAALGAAIENAGRERARDAVVGPLVQLAGAAAPRVVGDPVDAELLAEAALAAALALIARDLVAADVFTTLYQPFAALVPAPPAPG
jgi:hypothetical protein